MFSNYLRRKSVVNFFFSRQFNTVPKQECLAPPLNVQNSKFQEYTLTTRLPKLFQKMPNRLPPEGQKAMEILSNSLLNKKELKEMLPSSIHPKESILEKNSQTHIEQWEKFISEQNSVQRYSPLHFIPAIVSEMYFYHRIVDASGYFHDKNAKDPFLPQKTKALHEILKKEAKSIINYALDLKHQKIEKLFDV